MKKIIILSLSALLLLSVTKCKKPDNAIYDVLDGVTYGAALRTLEIQSRVFNLFDTNSQFQVTVEEQDEEYGDLLDKMNVYVSFIDNTDDGVDNNKAEKLLTSVPASSFSTGEKGLPVTSFSSTFQEALDNLGLSAGEYFGGDTFKFRFEVQLTDGRTFTDKDAGSTMLQSFFNSPYSYYVNIVCIPTSPFSGDYRLVMHDSYGDGWQGSKVIATIDGVDNEFSLPDLWTVGGGNVGDPQFVQQEVMVTVPAGTSTLVWSFVAGDYPSEVSFELYGPNSGNLIYSAGPSPSEGEFVPNYCNE
jgi:hypothetical protein